MLDKKVKELYIKLREECTKKNIPIKMTCGERTNKEQAQFYAQGRTKPGNIITNARAGESYHNYGLAFDICINIKSMAFNVALLRKVGAIGKSLGLEWGN